MNWIQTSLNTVIGVILLTNFYLLSGLTQIPMQLMIAFCFGVSGFYFVKNFNLGKFVNQINNWLFLFYLSFSLLLGLVDFLINKSAQSYNDLIRVLLCIIYFSWTSFMLKDKVALEKWIRNICISSILLLIIEGLFELFEPLIWTFLLSSNVEKRTVGRIAGALIDSNVFACCLIILFLSWLYSSIKSNRKLNLLLFFVIGILILYLIDLSGSRQGLIIIMALPVYYYFRNFSKSKFYKLIFVVVIGLGIITIFQNELNQFADENPSSSISRMFGNSNGSQTKSNDERLTSLIHGFDMLQKDYFILGPGMLNFSSRWAAESDTTEPHNGILFLLVQYGIFSLPIFYLFVKSYFRSKKSSVSGIVFIYFALIIHLMLQPNSMYYAITFFVLFYIDISRVDFFDLESESESNLFVKQV